MDTKICPGCHLPHPLDHYSGRGRCRTCKSQQHAAKPRNPPQETGLLTCTGCGASLEAIMFPKRAASPNGRAAACRSCASLRANSHYVKNRDKILQDVASLGGDRRLVCVLEDEWVHRRAAVEGFLGALLGQSRERVHARKCQVEVPDKREVRTFMDQNHIQLPGASRNRVGNPGEVELVRYCVGAGVSIPGGLAKLLRGYLDPCLSG